VPGVRSASQGADGLSKRLDTGVVVRCAPDQAQRERRQIGNGDQNDIVTAEHRYSGRRGVDDSPLGDQGHQLMNAMRLLGAADVPAGWRAGRDDRVVQRSRERRDHEHNLAVREVLDRHRSPDCQWIGGGDGEDPLAVLERRTYGEIRLVHGQPVD